MKPQPWKGVVIFATFLGLVIEPSFCAPKYALVELGIAPGFISSRATGINNRGQVVGWAVSTNDVTHAILWDNGAGVDLGAMGGSDSLASGISASGDIVGVILQEGKRHVFLWRKGQVLDFGPVEDIGGRYIPGTFNTDVRINSVGQVMGRVWTKERQMMSFLYDRDHMVYIGTPGWGIGGYLNGVNDRGQIVGTTYRTNGCSHAFLWQQGQMIDIGGLGGSMAGATVINERGMVIGWALVGSTPETAHAFVWEHGQMRDIGSLGGETCRAYGLNNLSQVVGYTKTEANTFSAFIWENGVMMDLNDFVGPNSGWRLTCADAINDGGQIAACATKNGQRRACLLCPIQERHGAVPESVKHQTVLSNATPFTLSGPVLTAFGMSPSGTFRLQFSTSAGGNYAVEASTNLTTWTPLASLEGSEARLEILDTNAPQFNLRFYRVVPKP